MKRCPVCGVMMGDNVARCSMCKYDFQKASQGDVNTAAADAKKVLEQKEQEKIARAEAKRSEEEKRIVEAMEKLERDYATMQDKFNSEKLKLDSEFSAFQKKKLDEKIALEQTVDTIRNEVGEAREKRDAMRKEADSIVKEAKEKTKKEHDEMIAAAQAEQKRILEEAQRQTEELAIQVEKEYKEAMAKRNELVKQAEEIQAMMDNADKIQAEKAKEVQALEAKIVKLNEDFEKEKVRIAEESKKVSMEQASEALKIKDQAEAERDKAKAETEKLIAAANAEREHIIAELEQRNKQAQSELDGLTDQARKVMAEAEEAAAKRDEMNQQAAAAREELQKQVESVKADLAAKEKELDQRIKSADADLEVVEAKKNNAEELTRQYEAEQKKLEGEIAALKNDLDEANRIIADSKKATVLAEAAAQEIVLNAEKQAVFLKECALSESEKGSMLKQIEELENQIKEKEMEKAELEKKLAALDESVALLEKRVREGGSGASDGPKEYSVEVVGHNSMSEVDVKALNELLKKKAADGWKLVSAIDDDGGKLLSSMGGSETASLSGGSFNTKQDRVVLIFERPAQDTRRVR